MVFANQYRQVLKLQVYRILGTIMVYAITQIILALGIAIGFTYLYADIDEQSLLYLATGAPTIAIILTGLVIMPNQICNARIEGHGDFLRTLPLNRAAIILADTTIWLIVTIPCIVISTLATHFIFQPGFQISLWAIPAYLLCTLTCIWVGYGFAYIMPPMLAMAFAQVLGFVVLMFSPINFPMDRFPVWLQTIHTVLPIDAMAKIMRAAFVAGTFDLNIFDVAKVFIWCVLGFTVAIKILNKK